MTPAEKPMESAKKLLFVVFAKKAMVEPMPVARPAPRVTAKARISALSIYFPLLGISIRLP
jgi:hypothetical protein